jgi:hypothetical protein
MKWYFILIYGMCRIDGHIGRVVSLHTDITKTLENYLLYFK